MLKSSGISKLIERNDTEYLIVKKKFPNKLIINFTSAKPICLVEIKDKNFILGSNGKILDTKIDEKKIPIVSGSNNLKNIFNVVTLIKKSNFNYTSINKIIFFKSGRFDINLRNGVVLKFPVKFNKKIINYGNNLLYEKKFTNSKIIDLRVKNKIIINE